MIQGLYLSAQGVEAQSFRQDIIANNLANASTPGFKHNLALIQAHRPYALENGNNTPLPGGVNEQVGGMSVSDTVTDFASRPAERTGGDLDLAIVGPGFLQVTDGKQEFLTRDGRLRLDGEGYVVTQDHGYRVLGTNGQPMFVEEPGPLEIAADGTVSQQAGQLQIGILGTYEPNDYLSLEKVGANLFQTDGKIKAASANTQLRQGYLEKSAVQPLNEMKDMIETSRLIDSNANLIKFQDESLSNLLGVMSRR
jgi:flagellar basal-body rod protein FlgG